jgi:hypothetical protein
MNPLKHNEQIEGEPHYLRARFLVKRMSMCILLFLAAFSAGAQGLVDQEGIRRIIENQGGDIDGVKQVTWQVYTVKSGELRSQLEAIPGQYALADKIRIIELANRVRLEYIKGGRRLVIPSEFPDDYRAYSPWPYHYEAAKSFPKLFVIDKYSQTFGAYENGNLAHWGLISSGRSNSSTPTGRYNFNWKTEYRLSNAAPEGEEWHLYWVFNFYTKIGLHVHQYALPINRVASHGCVRTARPDAQWNYSWANGWVGDQDNVTRNGTPVIVINDNPPGMIAAHWKITSDGTVESQVRLPGDLYQYPLKEKRRAPWESGW